MFIPLLATKYGVLGASIGYSLVGASSIIAIVIARKYVKFSLVDSMIKPLLGAFVMSTVLLSVREFLPVSFYSMLILFALGLMVYGGGMYLIVGKSLVDDIVRVFYLVLKGRGVVK